MDSPNQISTNLQQNVLLIGGAARSGTTVIHRALCTAENSNPYISESLYLSEIMHLYRRNLMRYDARHADQFGSVRNFRELIWLNIRQYLSLVSVKYNDPYLLVIKHPGLTYFFSELSAAFLDFKFIVVVRDPRDVIASLMKVAERHKENKIISQQTQLVSIKQHCDYYISYYENIFNDLGGFNNRLIFVKYENFMNEPDKVLQRISQFSGAKYDTSRAMKFLPEHAAAANFDKKSREEDPFGGAFWSDSYTESITTDRIGKYKDVLNEAQIEEIQQRLQAIGSRFGYWEPIKAAAL